MNTWTEVYQNLKKYDPKTKKGPPGVPHLSTSEKRNITPKMTQFIFEKGQENPNGQSLAPAIKVAEKVAEGLKPGSERRKGVEKVLKALREGSEKKD